MKKTVIFDMDGVIVDSEPLHEQHIHHFLMGIGIADPQRFKGSLKGVSAHDTWRMLIEEFELPHDINDLIVKSRDDYMTYLEALPELPSIPGAVEFITYCHKKGYRLGLASSAGPKRIDMFLRKLKIRKYFEVLVSGDDVKRSKPAPDIFLLAAQKLGVKPTNCIVVEDARNGTQAAKAAGMKCIAYYGSDHNTDDLLEADLVVNDFHALIHGLKTGELPV